MYQSPSSFLLQRGYAEPLSSLTYWIPLYPITSININWSLPSCFPSTKQPWRLGLETGLSRKFKLQANCLVSLRLLSCSTTAGVTLQLLCMFHTCASFGDLSVASHLRDPVASSSRMHTSKLFFTLFHTLPLHDSHLNTGFLNAELQANLVWNKANKMVD